MIEKEVTEARKLEKEKKKEKVEVVNWKLLEQQYGLSVFEECMNPLREYKKMIGSYRKLTKGEEPYLLLEMKNGKTIWYTKVTQGVFKYKNSEGNIDRFWLSQKFLSTMEWGEGLLRYYNCTEGRPFPNCGMAPEVQAEEIYKIMEKQQLNFERNRKEQLEGETKKILDIMKGIGVLLAGAVGVLVIANMLGYDLIDKIWGAGGEEVVKEVARNVTDAVAKENPVIKIIE